MSKNPKRKNLRPQGKCAFCGNPGITKAHIFPEWLQPFNPATGDAHEEITGRFETFESSALMAPYSIRIRQGSTGSRKVRKVCGKCNSGWMSSIEERCKPIVVNLLNGEDIALNLDSQKLLAAWLSLIAMTHELLKVLTPAIPHTDREYLRANQEPPPRWRIWLARYPGRRWHDHVLRWNGLWLSASGNENIDRPKCNTQVTTLVIGRFARTCLVRRFGRTLRDTMELPSTSSGPR